MTLTSFCKAIEKRLYIEFNPIMDTYTAVVGDVYEKVGSVTQPVIGSGKSIESSLHNLSGLLSNKILIVNATSNEVLNFKTKEIKFSL